MKSIRRSICMALSLCIIASTVVGCSKTEGDTSSSTAETTKAETNAESSEEPKEEVKLTFWTAGTAQEDQSRITDAVNKYLKETLKSNIQVDYQELGWGSSDYDPKVTNALTTGQEVDVLFTCNWVANYQQNALNGYFEPLDDYLTQYPELVEILGQDFINASKIDGKSYALPANKEKYHSWGYLLRTDLVKKYNIDTTKIKSEKDLEPYFDQILAGEQGVVPLCVANQDVPGWKYLDWDNVSDDNIPGAFYPTTEGPAKLVNQFTTPEAVAFYKQMKDYVAKKYIRSDAPTLTSVTEEAATGKYFAYVQSLKQGKAEEMQAGNGIEWTQVDITPRYVTNRETIGSMLAIPKASKHKDEAMKFISLLYTDPVLLNMFIYGEEGIDYNVNADGTITQIEGSGYASANGWRFGDNTKNLRLSFEAADKFESWIETNKVTPVLQSYGFIFNNTDEKVATLISSARQVTDEYYKTLFMGQANDVDATVAEMDAKYKAAGVDDLIKEMQTQYDEWYKTK